MLPFRGTTDQVYDRSLPIGITDGDDVASVVEPTSPASLLPAGFRSTADVVVLVGPN